MENVPISVSDFVALCNQTLEYAYPSVLVVGEVSELRVSKNRWVYFNLKDDTSSVKFFGTVYQLPGPIENGMMLEVKGSPRLHNLYGFSINVQAMRPVGEGSIKKAFELLKAKLDKEGLFALDRKRRLPELPERIGVITSTQAAGYVDFTTILDQRWGGMTIEVADTQVQGMAAPGQIIRALEYFNQRSEPPEVIVMVRGGGSQDDLGAFNDEALVRAIAASRVPVLVGIGHEVDTTLADLVADRRAATPSNAAQLLVPDRRELQADVTAMSRRMLTAMAQRSEAARRQIDRQLETALTRLETAFRQQERRAHQLHAVLVQLDPRAALRRGYALVRDPAGSLLRQPPAVDSDIIIETNKFNIRAGVKHVEIRQDT